jgi:hypothetical protein
MTKARTRVPTTISFHVDTLARIEALGLDPGERSRVMDRLVNEALDSRTREGRIVDLCAPVRL